MTGGSAEPPVDTHDERSRDPRRRPPALGWRARLDRLQRAATRHRAVRALLDVQRAYDRSGGGSLVASLAFYGFFAMVPALLLFASLLGWVIEDRAARDQLIDQLFEQVEPLRDVAQAVLGGLASGARTGTILGVLGLVWGASGFYGALQGAMQRLFPGPGTRDLVVTRVRGLLTVVLVLGAMLGGVVVMVVAPVIVGLLRSASWSSDGPVLPAIDGGDVATAAGVLVACVVSVTACLAVYVAVPPAGPTVRQAALPALIAGTLIGLLTSLFGSVAPLLVRQWLGLGIVGSVFIALVWFDLVFQLLVYGAAFARLRRDRHRGRWLAPSI